MELGGKNPNPASLHAWSPARGLGVTWTLVSRAESRRRLSPQGGGSDLCPTGLSAGSDPRPPPTAPAQRCVDAPPLPLPREAAWESTSVRPAARPAGRPRKDSPCVRFGSKYSFHEGLWRHPFDGQHGAASFPVVAGSVGRRGDPRLVLDGGSEWELCPVTTGCGHSRIEMSEGFSGLGKRLGAHRWLKMKGRTLVSFNRKWPTAIPEYPVADGRVSLDRFRVF